ncbi:MAG: hypothetical protein PHC75_08015 [Burkholderiales bacterium]|nr:hypothetical protein [Burkholderiales bacterium]
MSTRSQAKIISKSLKVPIYLYQHYDGYALYKIVQNAIIRGRDRWNDPEYLTRIIFSEMIKDYVMGETGYGIGTSEHGDIEFLITVDIDNQTIQENNKQKIKFKDTTQTKQEDLYK